MRAELEEVITDRVRSDDAEFIRAIHASTRRGVLSRALWQDIEYFLRRYDLNSRAHTFYAVLVSVVLAGSALGQSDPVLTMEKVMTREQMRTIGIDGLTPIQRAALDRWLSDYTVRVIQFAQQSDKPATNGPIPPPTTYSGSGGGHWIKSKADNGAIVILEDGSMWEINSLDRIETALWLPISNVTILRASSPLEITSTR